MKGLKTTTISILVVGLLTGSAVGVAAQGEVTDSGAASVTGTISGYRLISGGAVTSVDGLEQTDGVVSAARWDASDARLTGDVTYTGNWLHAADGDVSIQSGTYELANEAGSWLGGATAYTSESLGTDTDTVILTGHGAYEGLTAYLVLDFATAPDISGVIIPSAMPSTPEPAVIE